MNIGALGDIHGRVIWKDIIKNDTNKIDKWIFVGDYFDTRNNGISGNKQLNNFKEILAFKRANPDKVILLTGNHDYHYMRFVNETYSGHQAIYAHDFYEVIRDALNDDSLQMCYQYENFLFTHAGITKTWCQDYEIDVTNLEQSINDLFKTKPKSFSFNSGYLTDLSGDDITQSPIWVRPMSLLSDMVDGVTCVVGHTSVKEVGITENLILIDTLGISEEYLVILDGVPNKAKLIR